MKILEAKKRDKKENLDNLRKNGIMPAVFYGKSTESAPISVSFSEFKKIWKEIGESAVFKLKIGDKELDALIHEVDIHPVSEKPRHADFYIIEKGQTITVNIPLEFIGESPIVKLGGVLVKVLHEVEVESSPADLPQKIEVDISILTDYEKHIFLRDLKSSKGVKIHGDPNEVVALVSEAKEEEEIQPAEVDMSAIEVEKKGKKEEEEEPAKEEEKQIKSSK